MRQPRVHDSWEELALKELCPVWDWLRTVYRHFPKAAQRAQVNSRPRQGHIDIRPGSKN